MKDTAVDRRGCGVSFTCLPSVDACLRSGRLFAECERLSAECERLSAECERLFTVDGVWSGEDVCAMCVCAFVIAFSGDTWAISGGVCAGCGAVPCLSPGGQTGQLKDWSR